MAKGICALPHPGLALLARRSAYGRWLQSDGSKRLISICMIPVFLCDRWATVIAVQKAIADSLFVLRVDQNPGWLGPRARVRRRSSDNAWSSKLAIIIIITTTTFSSCKY
jgi:hypothetical protein